MRGRGEETTGSLVLTTKRTKDTKGLDVRAGLKPAPYNSVLFVTSVVKKHPDDKFRWL